MAAKALSTKEIDESKIKTKIRRLYDIANVLSSIGLICKANLENRKPAFRWVGTEGMGQFMLEVENYGGDKPSEPIAVKKESSPEPITPI